MRKNIILALLLVISFNIHSQESESPNIILMIGDGMGLTQITSGMYSNNNSTSLEDFQYVGLSKTHSYDNLVTDSAASGTAMSSGKKTQNKVLGLDHEGNPIKSILSICQDKGYSTALIATANILHATPAAFFANIDYRYNYKEDELEDFTGKESYLASSTKATLNKLDEIGKPFFIMIEGAQIDWGGHDNDQDYMVSQFLEFNDTIEVVLEFAKRDKNTIVVVTADHETGGAAIVRGKLSDSTIKNRFVSTNHTASMVPVFSYGHKAHLFKGIYENTEIFNKLLSIVNQ